MELEAALVEDKAQVEAVPDSPPQESQNDNKDDAVPMEEEHSAAVILEESEAEPWVIFH